MSDFVIGLRGGIGTGKSTVSRLFEEHGIVVADADISARTIVEPGKPAYVAITEHFGQSILLSNKTLDRAKLRELVFSDLEHRLFLEQATHRAIISDLYAILTKAKSEYALLVLSTGTGKTSMMQRLLVVNASVDLQRERVTARDQNSVQQVDAIIRAQATAAELMQDADDIINNNSDEATLQTEVNRLHNHYLELAARFKKSSLSGTMHG